MLNLKYLLAKAFSWTTCTHQDHAVQRRSWLHLQFLGDWKSNRHLVLEWCHWVECTFVWKAYFVQGTEAHPWKLNGVQVGIIKEARNLSYYRIFNGSHMVGVDHPREVYDMINRFVKVQAPPVKTPPTPSISTTVATVTFSARPTAAPTSPSNDKESGSMPTLSNEFTLEDYYFPWVLLSPNNVYPLLEHQFF